jgi:hypothetical protein
MSEVVSPYNKARINMWVIVMIVFGVVLVQIYAEIFDDIDRTSIVVSLVSTFAVGISALLISKRYWGSSVFGRSYLLLSAGFFSVFVGEITYNVYAFVLDVNPYPSIADVFFFMMYPFMFGHMILNIRAFRPHRTTAEKILVISIAVSIVGVFAYLAYATAEFDFDVYYGLIFVGGAGMITALGIHGIIATRKIPLGRAWFLLVAGIVLGTIADVWYHHLELFGNYDTSGIVNVFWYMSYWFIVYSLYKHAKII